MTKLQMLAQIYAHLSAFYGQELTPTNRVISLAKDRVNFLYNVYLFNNTFVGSDIRAIEENIRFQVFGLKGNDNA